MCVLMWDLELDVLVVQMFPHFLNSIRPDHPDQVFMDIEEIISIVIKEHEEIPMQLLNILISSVKKENQNASPRSYVLGESSSRKCCQTSSISSKSSEALNVDNDVLVLTPGTESKKNVCSKAKLYWVENALEELAPHAAPEGVAPFLDQPPMLRGKADPKHKDADVVIKMDNTLKESECGDAMKQQISTDSRTTSRSENLGVINAAKKALDAEATQTSKKRCWKPTFLNKPEEGYDDAWISGERRSKSHALLKGRGKDTETRSSSFPKLCIKQRKRKNSPSEEEGEATDDPTPPTMTMQHNLTPKGVHQNKGVKVVDVHGYKVKVSSGPILTAIFAKYGDIAANCHYRSLDSRASLLDLVCDVV